MGKVLFIPVSVAGGLVAGIIGKQLFKQLWGLIDEEQPPEPEHRRISMGKLVAALAMEGAVFRVVRGVMDHGSRHGYMSITGRWPGEEEPEPE